MICSAIGFQADPGCTKEDLTPLRHRKDQSQNAAYLQHGPGMLRMAGSVPHVPRHPATGHHLLGNGHKPAGQRGWQE